VLKIFTDAGPKPPTDINVRSLGSFSAFVSWRKSPLNVDFLVIAYNILYYQTAHPVDPVSKVVKADIYNVTLDRLKANTNYTVYIETFTSAGKSKPSKMVTVVTDVDSKYNIRAAHFNSAEKVRLEN
jgi:hypothetical protein